MLHRSRIYSAPLALLIMATLACGPLAGANSGTDSPGAELAPVERFTAEATSPVSVLLRWPAEPQATKYVVEVRYGEGDFFPLAEVAGDQTSYEDFPAPDAMALTYRLQAVTASAANDGGTASVTTPAQEPNPFTVGAVDYEPATWEPPEVDLTDPNFDPSSLYPPGFDPDNPEDFDAASLMVVPSATAEIGPEGGVVSVTSLDEVTFTLTVPALALDDPVAITLTPVAAIDGLPLSGGLLAAVRIEPEGLWFDLPFLLTITLPEGQTVPAGNQILGFAFEGEGEEFHLCPFAPAGGLARGNPGAAHTARPGVRPLSAGPLAEIAAQQARSLGVGAGTRADAKKVVREHRPSAADAAVANWLAYGQMEVPELVPLIFAAELSANRILERARDARTWDQVMETLDNFEFHNRFYGKDERARATNEKIWDLLLEQLNKLLLANKDKCLTGEDFSAQAVAHRLANPKRGSFSAQMAERFKAKYGDQALKDAAAIAKNCQLTLNLTSMITADFPGVVTYIVSVAGPVRLRWVSAGGKPYLTGTGTLTYEPIRINHPLMECTPFDQENTITAFITITRLEPVIYDPGGALKDFVLRGFEVTDAGRARFVITCDDGLGGKVTMRPSVGGRSLWHGYYTAAHVPEREITDWTLLELGEPSQLHSVIAKKEWHRASFTPLGGFGNWAEDTVLRLEQDKQN
jgi:hypothetical protein